MAQLGDLLEALKDQFNLPAKPIPLQDDCCRKLFWRKSRQYHDVLGVNQSLGSKFGTFFASVASKPFMSQHDGGLSFAYHTNSCGHRGLILIGNRYVPNRDLTGLL